MNYVEINGVSVFVKAMSVTNAKCSAICLSDLSCPSKSQSTSHSKSGLKQSRIKPSALKLFSKT